MDEAEKVIFISGPWGNKKHDLTNVLSVGLLRKSVALLRNWKIEKFSKILVYYIRDL